MKFLAPIVAAFMPELDIAFSDFQQTYGKKYPSNELKERLAIFATNMEFIKEVNSDLKNSVTVGVGPFADLTEKEFQYFVSTGRVEGARHATQWGELKHLGTLKHDPSEKLPESVDWVKAGGVTHVKDQGACGSCWSFSTTGALEGQYFANFGKLLDLSEQNLLDCDNRDDRCDGGLMDNAFTYVQKHGLCTEESYKYKCADAESEECLESRCHTGCKVGITPSMLSGYKDIKHDTLSLMRAITEGPVSVAIEADSRIFQHYSGGVITNPLCGDVLDHGVLCVGYGTEENIDYWLVKNSWGGEWGVNGYVKIGRGLMPKIGECGILEMASYPVFEDRKRNEIFA